MRTVYSIWLNTKEIVGTFSTLGELYSYINSMTKAARNNISHIFEREIREDEYAKEIK